MKIMVPCIEVLFGRVGGRRIVTWKQYLDTWDLSFLSHPKDCTAPDINGHPQSTINHKIVTYWLFYIIYDINFYLQHDQDTSEGNQPSHDTEITEQRTLHSLSISTCNWSSQVTIRPYCGSTCIQATVKTKTTGTGNWQYS